MRSWIAALSLVTAFSTAPARLLADESQSLEELVVAMADTPADHAAVARHFRAQAEEARAASRRHASMGRAYGGGKLNTRIQLRGHCDKLVEQYQAMAVEYEELAKLHDRLASPAP